ncbi:MAG TPA: hypothetical protein VIT92_16450, partial [Burkholderiaceae bacterium]
CHSHTPAPGFPRAGVITSAIPVLRLQQPATKCKYFVTLRNVSNKIYAHDRIQARWKPYRNCYALPLWRLPQR